MELIVRSGNDLPGAGRLLGLVGIKEDLNVVNDLCLAALDLTAGDADSVHALDEKGRTWLHAFYVSAVITYARCFVGGVRTRLDLKHVRLSAGAQPDAAVEVHEALMLTRDKHVAHPVSPYEDGILGLIIRPDDTVYGLDQRVFKQTTAPAAFTQLQLLSTRLLTLVNEMIIKQHTHLLARARALTPAEIAALPEAEWIPPGVADLSMVPTDVRTIPEGGAWGYVIRVNVQDDVIGAGQTAGVGADGPMRHRQSIIVTGPDNAAVVRDMGVKR